MEKIFTNREDAEENFYSIEELRTMTDTGPKPEPIVAMADLRYWRGGHCGTRLVESGNLRDCFFLNGDANEFFLTEKGELMQREYSLKNGVCQYYYRRLKEPFKKGDWLAIVKKDMPKVNRITEPIGDVIREMIKHDD